MLSIQPLALPGAKHVLKLLYKHQRPGLAVLPVRARKQTEKQDVEADLATDVLPADLQKLSKLAKTELQHQLEVRGLDKDGNKEELANRLLDTLIAQESVLSSSPPDRVKLQQQLEQPAAAAAPGRRGRRTSRKATASADPQPEPVLTPKAADPVIAAAATAEAVEAPAATSRRGRRTSRKATNSSDPLPSPADIIAASTGDGATEAKPTRRGRKTSRKATTSADPVEDPAFTPAQNSVAAAAEASATAATDNAAAEASTGAVNTKRGRRSKTTAVDPSPAAAEVQSAPAKADRARRTSRKSSVLEPETTDSAPTAASVEAPARQRGRRTSSTKTASKAPTAAAGVPSAANGPTEAAAGTPPVSPAKLLAQQLAKKEIAVHGTGAGAAGATAAAASAPAPAAPGSAWVGDQLLYAGSQAQSDSLLMGGSNGMQAVGAESTFSVDNGSVDEVFAQLTAERAAGLADEPQLRPEATFSGFEAMTLPPFAGTADAAASLGAAAAAEVDGQHPSLTDCVAAVEEPLTASAEAVEVDEAPDAAMAAFDHMYVHIASPAAAEADLQHPNLSDCVAAVEEPLLTKAEAVVLDEAPDAAMAAFDHVGLDTPGAAAVASGNQSPSLQDIALAAEPSALPASLDESLGEDEEPDVTLAAFDHFVPDAPRSETAAAAAATAAVLKSADEGAAAARYDQAYLDPLQPSALDASVGSGSVDLAGAEAEVVVGAAAAAGAKAAAPAAAPEKQQQQQPPQQKQGGQEGVDFSVMMQRWWSSVMQMFEDWQKNLSGPK